jgi:hypothetical protein
MQWLTRTMVFSLGFTLVAVGGMIATRLSPQVVAQESASKAPLRHVVLFKFKDDATKEQVQEIVAAFQGLPKKIDGIAAFEWGTNNSPEGLADGFTHCFVVTFKDTASRDTYLPHQAHKDFVAVLRPSLDKVLVVDYFAQK